MFVATDRILGRKIVIKVLSPELTAEVNRGRFRREMQVAAQLQHPHIVPLLSAGEQDDLLYFTMPFIKGESLKTAIEKDGGMSVPEVVRVLYHVGAALDYAHAAGIVHRDIKPANILRSGSYALITDFGVAKALNAAMSAQVMTSTGMAIGTPMYMAPSSWLVTRPLIIGWTSTRQDFLRTNYCTGSRRMQGLLRSESSQQFSRRIPGH